LQNADVELPIAILNLGGVGNMTWMSNDDMIAFDTGPANAMIDDWVAQHTSKKFDKNGEIASSGNVDNDIVEQFLSNPYFQKQYPKSLDRNDFQSISVDDLSMKDGAATLTEMTVQAVAKAIDLCPSKPNAIYVTGGGRHNNYMMKRFADVMALSIHTVDDLGWNGDAMEAEGFAYMAVRSLLKEPISFPKTTGCAQPFTGGVHVRAMKNRKTA
jgi:anhydro-N-acetylmuramic acid kinase